MCPNGNAKINFQHPAKLLQETLKKIRKFLQKCPTLEKIIISNPAAYKFLLWLKMLDLPLQHYQFVKTRLTRSRNFSWGITVSLVN